MKLADAQKVAEGVALLFAPFCERIEIAGSVRRLRPECGDIDLVAIPKFREHRDLLGNVERRENLLRSNLVQYVRDNRKTAHWASGKEPQEDGKNFTILGRRAQVDIFCATPATFATVLLTRTGSKEHNVWISERARARRAAFKASEGLWLHDRGLIHPQTEHEFYSLLGLPFIEPPLRERINLMRVETEAPCR